MKSVNMDSHDFQKQNLITIKGKGDLYKCSVCGAEGYRPTIHSNVILSESEYKKASKCLFAAANKPSRPKQVLTGDLPNMGVKYGIHDVVACPDEYKNKYESDVWVFSEGRQEPVRLFSDEYEIVE